MAGAFADLPPCPPFPEFTAFERAALEAFAEESGEDGATLRARVAAARVVDRINTSVGFFTRVVADQTLCAAFPASPPLTSCLRSGHFEVEGVALA